MSRPDASQVLIFPPYVGEFGWELMNWQGVVRRRLVRARRGSAIVAVTADRRALYEDLTRLTSINVSLVAVDISRLAGRPSEDHRIDDRGQPIEPHALREAVRAVMRDAGMEAVGRIEWPDYRGRLWSTGGDEQLFRRLGRPRRPRWDVLLVPRARDTSPERNLPPAWWDELQDRLRGLGLSVGTYPPGLGAAIDALSASRLAAGGSTGGLHLAALCGCPHFVWGPDDGQRWTRIGMSNRQRYETIWNPLGTPVRYAALGWRPSTADAAEGIVAALTLLGRTAARPRGRLVDRVSWLARRQAARLWARPATTGWCPWRWREFARARLT